MAPNRRTVPASASYCLSRKMVEALALGYRGVRAPKSKFWGLAADAAVEGLLDDMLVSGAFTPRLLSGCLLGFLRTGGVSAAYGDR